jgi:glycosyltransferase involved in cell wall biosynthesis
MKTAAARADAHIAISTAVRRQIGTHTGHPEKVQVIPDGVDGSEFPLVNGHRATNPDQLLYVGHVNAVKGVDVLLRALRIVRSQRPATRLVVVGATFYKAKRMLAEQMQALAHELGLDDDVDFVGAQPHDELVRHMHESALLVLPSRSESFGCVLIEALATGTPVVATRCGGPEDIVHDGVGTLVPPGDERALASAILDVLARRAQFEPARLRAYALENFSWQHVAERTAGVYRQVLNGGRAPR